MKITKSKPAETHVMSTISAGTKFTGNLDANAALRIDGELDGDIQSTNKLVTGVDSLITGTVEAEEILIGGKINGTVNAAKIILQSTGFVNGDIKAKEIVIESGGMFNGACEMNQNTPTIALKAKQA